MARIKLAYPKIPGSADSPCDRCIAFEKYDGTNMHWVWERELGWYAFGMRRNRFDLDELGIAEFNANHPGYEDASEIFKRDFAEPLATIFRENLAYNSQEVTVFTEYFGANSFAGLHKAEEPKQLILFDVETERGLIQPEQFIEDFGALKIARVVYRGKLTGKFADDVRTGKHNVNEGVVCKGSSGDRVWMVKIKTNAYMERLQQAFKDDWENYWE
ncbi:MAG: RNA ligase family protein [Cyanobacteria bacterium P01_E01_bin.42]